MDTKPFAELGLSPKVLAAVEAAGYTTATPIQSEAIPVALTGLDVLGIAQTGTGKTAAFTLPMICRLETGRARARMPRSLILAPTRELAAQVAQAFEKYGVNHKLDVALLIGGVSMDDQVKKLDRGVDVLIATPGRLIDHFQRGRIMLMGVEILVIDEADRMLDMGFIPDIEKICKLLPPKRQTLFFSATMPPEITRLVEQFLRNPVRIEVAKPATTAKTITQMFCFCPSSEDYAKRETLRDLIRSQTIKNGIIFCNRKRDVAILHKSLVKHGFNAGALHGDMDQKSRTETLDKFRAGEITLLAASDVAARGLDIPEVSHVFNFDLPWHSEDYVHRIGRTGRAGREGKAFSLVTHEDLKNVKDIGKLTGDVLEWLGDAPTEADWADAGKRRRGRGGSSRDAGRDGGRRGGDDRRNRGHEKRDERRPHGTAQTRPDQSRPDQSRPAASSERSSEERHRPDRDARPERRGDAPRREERQERHQQRPDSRQPSLQPGDAPHRAERGDHPQGRPRQDNARPAADNSNEHRPASQRRPDQRTGGEAGSGAKGGAEGGFAENVPAFLMRPARPQKVANE
ncbi:MAG: DEAD/DEAH box helicase [Hyphomicrobium sp.]|nr:DEAD/DEAH box helicase [Hyphomicrobium sp.]